MEEQNKELKDVVDFGLSIGMAVDKSLADDGKISLGDAGNLVDPIMKAPAAVMSAPKALDQLKALTPEGRLDLNSHVQAKFDIKDDKVEAVVEESINCALSVARIIALVTKKDEAVAAPSAPAEPSAAPA